MRRLLLVLVASLFATASLGQEAPQRGRIKKVDTEKGIVTITTEAGKDVEAALMPQTIIRDGNGQAIADFREKGAPAGTNVMFQTEERNGRTVLARMRVGAQQAGPQKAGGKAGQKGGGLQGAPPPPPPRDSIGVKPLTELGKDTYKGETGGLYGNGSNDPPAAQQEAAKKAVAKIQPLDAQGKPSSSGKIGLVSVGMSNTTQEFSVFKRLADSDAEKSSKVAVVDLAQGGKIPETWNNPSSDNGKQVWSVVDQRLKAADVSYEQVQVAWIKQAIAGQGRLGEFPAHAKRLESDLITTLHVLKQKFPNLQLAYMSSRIYAGYATTALNPEPYAYEGAFPIRWIIDAQIKGDPQLNWDPARGDVKAPVVLWGPYLWGDGTTPRKDGLVWNRDDLRDNDGTHPSPSGQKKVADMLVKFFHSDPFAKGWYLGR
jgi:Cu/Ag efflux protein CusF